MNSQKKVRINRENYARAVLTETAPYEVPIIFSNEGLYKQNRDKEKSFVYKNIIDMDENCSAWTKPFNYKIVKDHFSYRALSLFHPSVQYRIAKFYKEYDELICYYTSLSEATIRAPKKIASSYFYKNTYENLNRYKLAGSVDTLELDTVVKNPNSYFAYKGYNRLYKFYNSIEFIKYEKKYCVLWIMDVIKCFPSIYTHTISWALKNKEYAKQNSDRKTFADRFDAIMRECNDGQTNGVLIGSEFSRVFAEIIFQDIDINVIKNIKEKYGYEYGRKYIFKRYVDDFFIFASNDSIAQNICDEITEELSKYNFYVNQRKLEQLRRPFFTIKSRIIHDIKIELGVFIDKFTDKIPGQQTLIPKNIHSYYRLKLNFIEAIKSICMNMEKENKDNIRMAYNFIISALLKRIKLIIEREDYNFEDRSEANNYYNCLILITELLFFYYGQAPTIAASFKLSQAIIFVHRFMKKYLPGYVDIYNHRVYELSIDLLINEHFIEQEKKGYYVPLEKLNIIIALSEMGKEYLIPAYLMRRIFQFNSNSGYFEIMSCLFYMKNHSEYPDLKVKLMSSIKSKLIALENVKKNSETAYIFVDTISCPFIEKNYRIELLKEFYRIFNDNNIPGAVELEEELMNNESAGWFINWKEIDLLNILEKKEAYNMY